MSADIETVVIGAGVIGLAIARAFTDDGGEVMVLERHKLIGAETSSRNSEVIHAGIYYPRDSMRARFCVRGKDQLYNFAQQAGIPVKRCGKILVATSPDETPQLDRISAAGKANGVSDLCSLSPKEVRELEPDIACVAALHSPSTGIIDAHALMLTLEGLIEAGNGQVVLNVSVENLSQNAQGNFVVTTQSSDGETTTLTARNLIIAAGLEAQHLAAFIHGKTNGSYMPPKRYLAKAHYYTLSTRVPFKHLIYPVPPQAGLGIHLTLDMAGQARFGPDLTWIDQVDYTFDDADGRRQADFETAIRRYWPSLPQASLQPGYTGIRPKIHPPGTSTADFAIHGPEIHGIPRLIGLYGIESPGLTCCLSIADHVRKLIG